jgi:putative ABC transport system permease protein
VNAPKRRGRRTMPLREILFIFRARMKAPVVRVQEGLAVVGIAIGVALLFASQVASQSLNGSVRQLASQLVGGTDYQLDARGPEGFPGRLLEQAQASRGVGAASPLVEAQATIVGPRGRAPVDLIGVDPRFTRIGGPLARNFSGSELAGQKLIALPKGIAETIGARNFQLLHLQTGKGTQRVRVGALLGSSEVGALASSGVALAPLRYVQELIAAGDRVSRIFIKVKPGQGAAAHNALAHLAAANNINLVPADFDASLFAVASGPAEQGESLFSAISAFVGFLFAFNAMLLTVGERRRVVGTMRRLGTSRWQVLQALVFDALVLGSTASIFGLLLGELLSIELFHPDPGYLAFAFPVGSARIVSVATVAESVGAGIAAALVGILWPFRDIVGKPLRQRREKETPPRGWTTGLIATGVVCLATTTLIVIYRPQSAVVGIITLALAAFTLLPFLFTGIVYVFAGTQRRFASVATRLAVGELRDSMTRLRSLTVAATGAIAVFASVAIAGAQHNLQSGLDGTAREWNQASSVWVSISGENNTLATTPFPESVAAKVRQLPAVGSVRIYRGGFLNLGDRRLWVIAPPSESASPIPAGQLTSGGFATANRRLREGGWAVLSEAVAHERHLHIASTFRLPTPHPATFRLAGLSTNGGWPPGAVVINAGDYAKAWGSSAASALNIQPAVGYQPAATRLEVATALGSTSGLTVQTATEREAQWKRISHQGLQRLSLISLLVSIAAVAAMAGVMGSLIWQRRERIAYFRRTGNTRGLLWRALFWESGVLLGSGCLIGAVFGLYGQLVISHALTVVTGFPITISVGAAIAFFSFLLVSATALAIVALLGNYAVRVEPSTLPP